MKLKVVRYFRFIPVVEWLLFCLLSDASQPNWCSKKQKKKLNESSSRTNKISKNLCVNVVTKNETCVSSAQYKYIHKHASQLRKHILNELVLSTCTIAHIMNLFSKQPLPIISLIFILKNQSQVMYIKQTAKASFFQIFQFVHVKSLTYEY